MRRGRGRAGQGVGAAHSNSSPVQGSIDRDIQGDHSVADGADNSHTGDVTNLVQAGSIAGNVIFESSRPPVLVPRQLKQRPVTLIGRTELLNDLSSVRNSESLPEHGSPVVVIFGSPGVGKTALVLEWSHQHRSEFNEGDLFADFHDFDTVRPASCEEVFDGFLRGLGVPALEIPGTLDSQASMFRSILADRKVLIVLDNVSSADRVRPFMAGSNSLILVTSRNSLRGLAARDGAHQMAVDTLTSEESVRLLAEVVGAARIAAEPEAALQLASLCSFLPLALRIAADQVNARPYLTIAEHVQDLKEEGELESLSIGDDERAQVKAVFSWSYNALNPTTALVFRSIGVHPGRDIALAAIRVIADLPERAARRAVQELLSVSLISEGAPGRFSLHDLLRAYAFDQARSDQGMNSPDEATRRLINWYVVSADNANIFMTPGLTRRGDLDRSLATGQNFNSFDEALRWLDEERSNLIDITRRAGEIGEHHAAAIMPNLLWSYFNLTKHWSDWITCNEIGLASARESGDTSSEAYLLTSQGVAYRNLRQTDLAVTSHREAIRLFEQLDDNLGLGYAKQNLGNVLSDAGQFEEALGFYQEALEIFARIDDPRRGRGVTLNSMAVCYNDMGRYSDAFAAASEAQRIMQEIGDDHGIAFSFNSIGRALTGQRQFDSAIDSLQSAIDLRQRIGDRYGQGRSLLTLGRTFADSGRPDQAREAWSNALAIFTDLGAPERIDAEANLSDGSNN